jgi:hypothetical protein
LGAAAALAAGAGVTADSFFTALAGVDAPDERAGPFLLAVLAAFLVMVVGVF